MNPTEQQLSEVVSDFARTTAAAFSVEAILDLLVQRIVDILPIRAAGVTLMAPGSAPRFVAASDPVALRYEELHSELGDGPSLLAYRSGQAVGVPDLLTEPRFPHFTGRARGSGLAAIFAFPLRHGEHTLGALNLYRDMPGELSVQESAAAQTLADTAAAYLLDAQARADLRDTADRSHYASLHDTLTGLPNRVLLLDRLQHAFLRSRRTGMASAVFFVDLVRSTWAGDPYGRAGDELLMAAATRLAEQLRPHDTMARLSGDELVVICEDLDDDAKAGVIGARMVDALSRPFEIAGAALHVDASIGIAVSAATDRFPEKLLREADVAMYHAKRAGGNRCHLFDRRQQNLGDRQTSLEGDLQQALSRGQLHAEYQPIVATAERRITGFEALLRWSHPTRGLVPPSTLIPLAEQSGLITEIGQWMLHGAWTDRNRWQKDVQGDNLSMSVNVSAHQLMSVGFPDVVAKVLASNQSDPALLTLEVTENVFVLDGDRALAVLTELKSIGVVLALDDFGTGLSSLGYLRRFPVDIVKIDRSFVADLGHDFTSHAMVEAVVRLAHALGLNVVAEGVETAEQHREVAEMGCDFCQGYYFAHPMAAESVDSLLRRSHSGSSARLPA